MDRVIDATGCKVLLTSSWRYLVHGGSMTLEGLNNLFKTYGFSHEIFDITEPDCEKYKGENRGCQIMRWLHGKYDITHCVVVDDLDLKISRHSLPFVQTVKTAGLNVEQEKIIINILNGPSTKAIYCEECL